MKGVHKKAFFNNIPIGFRVKLDIKLGQLQLSDASTVSNVSNESDLEDLAISPETSTTKNIGVTQISNLDINFILQQTSCGQDILKFYRVNNKLTDGLRTLLVDKISEYLVSNKIRMSVGLAKTIAQNIVQLFPTETEVI